MDPVAIATAVLTVLSPYLARVGEKVADKFAETLPENAGKLWSTLAAKFKGKDTVKDLAENPTDGDAQGAFRLELKKALTEDPEFMTTVAGLLEKAQQEAFKSGAAANDHSVAINVGGNVQGHIIIGNNNAVNFADKKK